MKFTQKPYVVIGSGIAGLYTAIKLSERLQKPEDEQNPSGKPFTASNKEDKEILIITKSDLRESNSRYAQGGIVGVLPENFEDSVELHVEDTIKAGAGLTDPEVAHFISAKSAELVKDLITHGVNFDKQADDKLEMTIEGAHSVSRILHSGGDATGKSIEVALSDIVEKDPKFTIYRKTRAVDLLIDSDGVCRGVIVFDKNTGEYETIFSSAVIIATGGAGQVYSKTTNPRIASGDGIELAYRAGAVMQNMEFMQFHPTALNFEENGSRFLISESVRGEGAKLKTIDGEEFACKYHEKADLAPRDVVSRAIFFEMQEHGYDHVLLDTTKIPEEKLRARFPNIIKACSDHGIDMIKTSVPVSPAAHYIMGGIKTNIKGETSVKGLYAVGEAGCTSFHGANRLASNSLLECVVVAHELAEFLTDEDVKIPGPNSDCRINCLIAQYEKNHFDFKPDIAEYIGKLRETMWEKAGIVRNKESLEQALGVINELKLEFNQQFKCRNAEEYRFRSLLTVAELIVKSAIARRESRGGHFREDYPDTSKEASNSYISKSMLDINMKTF